MDRGATMLLSDPTAKKAARTKGNTWRQEILDIRSTFFAEGAAEDWFGRLLAEPAIPVIHAVVAL